MSITESLKAQLTQLTAQRREHEKAVNTIKRNEIKVRKAIAQIATLPGPVVNLFQFVFKLMESGREFTLLSFGDRHYVEVGRFAYCFNRFGKSMGGWIHKPENNAEWNDWIKLMME